MRHSSQSKSTSILFANESEVLEDPEEQAQQLIRICRKPQVMRTEFETQIMKNSLRNIKFFRDQFDAHYEDMLEDVCESAKLLMMTKGEVVFLQDTTGETFYMIIKGQVRITKRISYVMGQVKNKKGKMVDHVVEQIKLLTMLTWGDAFGELALIEKKPRAANVTCDSDCYFLTLDKDAFNRIIATKAKRQFIHLLEKLRQNSILRELSNNTVKALFMVMEKQEFQYGDHIYRQGSKSDSLYFISQGEFRLQQETYHTQLDESLDNMLHKVPTKTFFDIKVAGVNECIGLEDFIKGGAHESQAICASEVGIVFKLDRVDYKRLEQRYPDFCQIMIEAANEKKEYYQEVTKKVSAVKKQVQHPEPVFISRATKHLRKIITEDPEMDFIQRDHITMNEDNDILLKFSKFFQYDQRSLPFQVNTVDEIQKHRIQSAGYRTLCKVVTQPHPLTVRKKPKRKPLRTQTHKDQVQDKMQKFLQLNIETIQLQAKEIRQKREQLKSGKSQPRAFKQLSVDEFYTRTQSPAPTSNAEYSLASRPTTAKSMRRLTSGTLFGKKCSVPTLKNSLSDFDDVIHSRHLKNNLVEDKLKKSMEVTQMPLKYHSETLKRITQQRHKKLSIKSIDFEIL